MRLIKVLVDLLRSSIKKSGPQSRSRATEFLWVRSSHISGMKHRESLKKFVREREIAHLTQAKSGLHNNPEIFCQDHGVGFSHPTRLTNQGPYWRLPRPRCAGDIVHYPIDTSRSIKTFPIGR